MHIIYRNNIGEEIDLNKYPFVLQSENLYDYAWEYESTNSAVTGGVISGFYRDVTEISAELIVHATTENEFIQSMNQFHRITEKDVRDSKEGKLIVNGAEYMKCYIIAASNNKWSKGIRTNIKGIKIVTASPFWYTDVNRSFYNVGTPESDEYLDYPYDAPYDYSLGGYGQFIKNDYVGDAHFIMTIHGPAINPAVYIGGHLYEVRTEIIGRECIIIDSRAGTVSHKNIYGEVINVFNLRNKESDIFKKIVPGKSAVKSSCKFDIAVMIEKSEPTWIL